MKFDKCIRPTRVNRVVRICVYYMLESYPFPFFFSSFFYDVSLLSEPLPLILRSFSLSLSPIFQKRLFTCVQFNALPVRLNLNSSKWISMTIIHFIAISSSFLSKKWKSIFDSDLSSLIFISWNKQMFTLHWIGATERKIRSLAVHFSPPIRHCYLSNQSEPIGIAVLFDLVAV